MQRCEAVGRRLELDEAELSALRYAATLHDIGELGVPEAILNKPGPLTDEERPAIERHPLIGEGILSPLEFLVDAVPLVRAAHERWDGTGYPDGLAGEADPAGRAHPVRLRHLRGDDHRAALPPGAGRRTRPSRSCARWPGRSWTRASSTRCSDVLDAGS